VSAVLATSFRPILAAIKAQLAAVPALAAERVLVAQRDRVPHIQGDSDAVVRVGKPLPEDGFTVGSGRHATVLVRPVQVTPRVRWAVDEGDRDDHAMEDADSGLLALEEAVIDALHVWVPTTEDEEWLTVQPLHWVPSAEPVRETPVNHAWLHSDLVFMARYQLSLSDNGY
jgi:hypothetical protein